MSNSNAAFTEAQVITLLTAATPAAPNMLQGPGDDAAVLALTADKAWVITQDALVESIHFRRQYYTASQIAHKALEVNLSDIAAMGAQPQFMLLSLSLPNNCSLSWIEAFSSSLRQRAALHQIALIGGDTTGASEHIYINITLLGTTHPDHIKYRNCGQAGDVLCVTGMLGEAYAGWLALERGLAATPALIQRQCLPQARLAEGLFLGRQPAVHAMMDLSDGLYLDLPKLAQASQLGAAVEVSLLPLSSALQSAADSMNMPAQELALMGGEDYELLFTVAPDQLAALQTEFHQQFGYHFYTIGYLSAKPQIHFLLQGETFTPTITPYTHFRAA